MDVLSGVPASMVRAGAVSANCRTQRAPLSQSIGQADFGDEVAAMFSLIKQLRARLGYDKYSAETFDRLTQSMHVEDLRWVANVTAFAALLAMSVILVMALVTDRLSV